MALLQSNNLVFASLVVVILVSSTVLEIYLLLENLYYSQSTILFNVIVTSTQLGGIHFPPLRFFIKC